MTGLTSNNTGGLSGYFRNYATFDTVIVLLSLRWITGNIFFALVGVAIFIIYLISNIQLDKKFSRIDIIFITLFFLIMMLSIYNGQYNNYRSFYYFLVGAICFFIGRSLSRNINHALNISFALIVSYFLLFFAYGLAIGFSPSAMDSFFPNSSRNGVSAIALFLQIFYSASYLMTYGSLPIITPFITFAIAILCKGRAGLAAAGIVLAISMIKAVATDKRRLVLCAGAVVVGMAALYTIPNSLVQEAVEHTNFYRRGIESIRSEMWAEYLERINARTFFTGVDLSTVPLIQSYNLNPHNSFIRGHSYFGIPYLIMVLVVLAIGARGILNRQWVLVCFLWIYLFRSAFDIVGFFDIPDFIMFFIIYSLIYRPHTPQES